MLLLTNALRFDDARGFVPGSVRVDGKRIVAVLDDVAPPRDASPGDDIIDLAGRRLIPGFVDLHFHGARGLDVMEADAAGLDAIRLYQAQHGTTSFLATTITSRMDNLLAAVERISSHASTATRDGAMPGVVGARIAGVHVEGPYINPKQKGCHRIEWMKEPDVADLEALSARAAGAKLRFTVAPELRGAPAFIEAATGAGSTVSLGHSDATAAQARSGLAAGAAAFTHLFNAMTGLHHREPGMVGAALASPAYVELICDGVHVQPEVVDLVYRCKRRDQILLVTDAMHAAGLGDDEYSFGGYRVVVKDGIARNEEGRLASSTITMLDAVRNMMRFTAATLEDVLPMATLNPARAIGLEGDIGSIRAGAAADLVVLGADLSIHAVLCGGEWVDGLEA
jgi:N-acetylglucosamine-6-phosphate deacetylase